ncbi:MAG: T9SS type A sorting domain-containing protein [Ignavibacteria bacterium]
MKRKNLLFLFIAVLFTISKVHGQYFVESFESPWSGSPPVPSGWSIIHTSATGGGGGTEPIYWAQNTWNGSSWSQGGAGNPLPSGAKDGASVAWYKDSDAKATQKDMLCSGNIDLTSSITPWVTFYLSVNSQSTVVLKLKASSNGGVNWNEVQTITNPGLEWTKIRIVLPSEYKVLNARIGFELTASYGSYDVWLDKVVVEEKPLPLTGIKTIKTSGGDFSTFSSAFEALNDAGVGSGSGGVIFNVDAGFTSTELCPILTVSGSSNATIVFQKNGAGNNPKIIASKGISATNDAILRLYGCDYVTFDGIDVAENPTNSDNTTRMEYGYSIKNISATNGAQYNTIKNCKITLNRTYTSTKGIGEDSLIRPTTTAGSNSFNKFQNISIENSYNGIYIIGNSIYPDIGVEISGCTIGATTNNDIGNGSSAVNGIRMSYIKDVNVFNNIVRNVTITGTGNLFGIYLENVQGSNSIYNNKVFSIKSTSTSPNSKVYGIRTDVISGSLCNIYNNVVYGLEHGINSANATIVVFGITIGMSGAGSGNFYYNSVRIDEDQNPSSACFYMGTSNVTVNLLNNVFANFSATGSTSKRYCLYRNGGTLNNVDYNNYYIPSGTNNFIGYYDSSISDLTSWRIATGKDRYSISADPGFTSSTNLQPDVNNANCWNLNGKGVPIYSVNTDILGNPRSTGISTGATDIGAYEFLPNIVPSDANQRGTIANDQTTIYTVGGDTIATITWHGANLPSSISLKYYTGINPSNIPGGSRCSNLYFRITPTGGSGYTYDLKLYYTPPLIGTITAESYIRLSHYSGGGWIQYQTVSPDTTEKFVIVNGLNSFSDFTFGDANAPLPIILAYFTAEAFRNTVNLKWKTLEEINCAGFEIERQYENGCWCTIAFIKSLNQGNSSAEYKYIDTKLNSGKYNYRLKQIDYNNNFAYYNLTKYIEVTLPQTDDILQNYPNPFNFSTTFEIRISHSSWLKMSVFDILGREVKVVLNEFKSAGYHYIKTNFQDLASGVYFCRLQKNGSVVKNIQISILK